MEPAQEADFVNIGKAGCVARHAPSSGYVPYVPVGQAEQVRKRYLGPVGLVTTVARWIMRKPRVGRHTPYHASREAVVADTAEATRLAKRIADLGGARMAFSLADYPDEGMLAQRSSVFCTPLRCGSQAKPTRAADMQRDAERRLGATVVDVTCDGDSKMLGGVAFYEVLALLRKVHSRIEEVCDHRNAEESEAEKVCCVCFESSVDLVLTCSHAFCSQCIMSWSQTPAPTCPLCRAALESMDDSYILFTAGQAGSEEVSEGQDTMQHLLDSETERLKASFAAPPTAPQQSPVVAA